MSLQCGATARLHNEDYFVNSSDVQQSKVDPPERILRAKLAAGPGGYTSAAVEALYAERLRQLATLPDLGYCCVPMSTQAVAVAHGHLGSCSCTRCPADKLNLRRPAQHLPLVFFEVGRYSDDGM